MPWSAGDASGKTHKANTPKRRRQWAHVANRVLAETGDEGLAVREANGVIAKHEFSADEERAMRHANRKRHARARRS